MSKISQINCICCFLHAKAMQIYPKKQYNMCIRPSKDRFQIAPEVVAPFTEYSHIRANSENQVFAAAYSRSSYSAVQRTTKSPHTARGGQETKLMRMASCIAKKGDCIDIKYGERGRRIVIIYRADASDTTNTRAYRSESSRERRAHAAA